MKIGMDSNGRVVSIHSATDEEFGLTYSGMARYSNGECTYTSLYFNEAAFSDTKNFPDSDSIWESVSYSFDQQAHRMRVYTAALHHAFFLL